MCACIHMHTNERINVQPIVFKKKEASCQRKTRNLSPPGLHATTKKKRPEVKKFPVLSIIPG